MCIWPKLVYPLHRSLKNKAPPKTLQRQISVTDVSCDICKGVKASAVKSCLVCRMSFCEIHLTPHLRDPVLTMHRLTDTGTFSHLCRSHRKILGMFCKDDQMPVCAKCTERDHKYHNTVPIEKEGKRVMVIIYLSVYLLSCRCLSLKWTDAVFNRVRSRRAGQSVSV